VELAGLQVMIDLLIRSCLAYALMSYTLVAGRRT
jgi:hypothetical protein